MPKPVLAPDNNDADSGNSKLTSYWQTLDNPPSIRLYHGDAVYVLSRMPEKSVQMVVTSPPYWALRDYGVSGQIGSEPSPDCGTMGKAQCGQCFVCKMVEVFTAVHRVLRDDGTLWLNFGDTYGPKNQWKYRGAVGIPWRVALALQANGWIIRQEIIWWKPDPMPAPVFAPCRNAHETIHLFSKAKQDYWYYDADAIRETGSTDPKSIKKRLENARNSEVENNRGAEAGNQVATTGRIYGVETVAEPYATGTRNKPSVWRIAKQGLTGSHFASFPEKLVEPCILSGASDFGCCGECGAPFKRVTEREALKRKRPNEYVKRTGEPGTGNSCPNTVAGVGVKTLGWEPTCDHFPENHLAPDHDNLGGMESYGEAHERPGDGPYGVPCTVLDPFVGSGTTALVGQRSARRTIGIDLSEEYLRKNAIPRIEGALLALGQSRLIPGKQPEKVKAGKRLLSRR